MRGIKLGLLTLLAAGCAGDGGGATGDFTASDPTTSTTSATDSGSSTTSDGTTDPSSTGASTGGSTGDGPKFDVATDAGVGQPDESTCDAVKESLSSAGCLFAPVVGNQNWTLPWAVVAANTNVADATVTLTSKDGVELGSATIAPGELEVFTLDGDSTELTSHQSPAQTLVDKKAMLLESDIPIIAYQFTPYASSMVATADASLLLPDHVWDDDYYAATYANDGLLWVMAVSLEDDNEITVTAPSTLVGSTQAGAGLPALTAGQSASVTIGAQQILKIAAGGTDPTLDLTGLRIESTKPVSVLVGSPSISIPGPGMNFYKDYIEETVPPRASWGTKYAAVKFRERGGEDDIYRFLADQDGTVIDLTGDYQDTLMLDAGEFAQVSTVESFYAESDKPFLVEHIMVSQDQTVGPKNDTEFPGDGQSGNCSAGTQTTNMGDPAITYLVPVDQYRQRYTFLTPGTYAWDNLTVVAREAQWDGILLDGAALPEPPTPLGASGWAHASFAVEDGPHVIEGNGTFGIEVYGYDCNISYAYPGGLNLQKINPAG